MSDLLDFSDLTEIEKQLEDRSVPDELRLHVTYSIAQTLLTEVKVLRAKNARLCNRVDMLEEEMWPFEWVVATEERERRKAAEARIKELEGAMVKIGQQVIWPDHVLNTMAHLTQSGYMRKVAEIVNQALKAHGG